MYIWHMTFIILEAWVTNTSIYKNQQKEVINVTQNIKKWV